MPTKFERSVFYAKLQEYVAAALKDPRNYGTINSRQDLQDAVGNLLASKFGMDNYQYHGLMEELKIRLNDNNAFAGLMGHMKFVLSGSPPIVQATILGLMKGDTQTSLQTPGCIQVLNSVTKKSTEGMKTLRCSICNNEVLLSRGIMPRFCMNCGAGIPTPPTVETSRSSDVSIRYGIRILSLEEDT